MLRSFFAGCLAISMWWSCTCEEPLATLVPDVVVSPRELDWGTVAIAVPVEKSVQIANRGTGTLGVQQAVVEPAESVFTVVQAPARVLPEGIEGVRISLTAPFAGTYAATLVLRTDDPDEPTLRIPLLAIGGTAQLVVSPNPVDLGLVHEGLGSSRPVTLTNDGFDFLIVHSVVFRNNVGFTLHDSSLPASLGPGESTVVVVALLPSSSMVGDTAAPTLLDDLIVDATTGTQNVEVRARINLAPVAHAVERDTRLSVVKVGAGAPVYVDGSETYDPEGDAFVFQWAVVERPEGSAANILGQGQTTVRTTPDAIGQYVVRLRATDTGGAFREAFVTLLPRDLAVVLTWAPAPSAPCHSATEEECAALDPSERGQRCCEQSDLDLHLVAPGGVLGDYGGCPAECADEAWCSEESDLHVSTCRSSGLDCAFANRAPEWGPTFGGLSGRVDDPRLDVDDVRGAGPEVISMNQPAPGTYRVLVHYCRDRSGEPSLATLKIFDQGILVASTSPQLVQEGQAWLAATLVRSDSAWTFAMPPDIFENGVPADLCSP
jgi:hypothetical protein